MSAHVLVLDANDGIGLWMRDALLDAGLPCELVRDTGDADRKVDARRPSLVVIKRDGTRELFSRDKLMVGLQHATEKTSVSAPQLESFVAQIERELYGRGEPEVTSTDIGELIMHGLSKLNEVAYVRFASVYRKFRDISSFERELSRIRKSKTEKK